MSMIRTLLLLVLLCPAAGCEEGDGETGRNTGEDQVDPGPDGSVEEDARATGCYPERTRVYVGEGPIEVGSWCDDITLCADDADEVALFEAAAGPDLLCEATGGGGCAYSCSYRLGEDGEWSGYVDQDDLERICELTLLLDDAELITCAVNV
jgi:hypothetical protein